MTAKEDQNGILVNGAAGHAALIKVIVKKPLQGIPAPALITDDEISAGSVTVTGTQGLSVTGPTDLSGPTTCRTTLEVSARRCIAGGSS